MKSPLCIVILSLVAYEVQSAVVGADRCTWGPSYWCKNYGAAKTCGAVDHCKTNAWNKPVKNDEICTLCKEGMEMVDNYLKEKATKAKIEKAILQICSDIPLADLKTECKQVVTENFDLIYDEGLILIGNGDMVCSAIGLCTSSSTSEVEDKIVHEMVKKLPDIVRKAMENNELPVASPFIAPLPLFSQPETPQEGSENYCADCQAFIKDVQHEIMNDPAMVKSWTNLVKGECDALGAGLDEICMQKAEEAIHDITSYHLTDSDVTTICNTIKMCGFRAQAKSDNDMCTDCTNFFDDWKQLMINNKTVVNEIIGQMSDFYCLQKPANLRKQCVRYVGMVIETFLNRLMQESPMDICRSIYFCEAGTAKESLSAITRVNTLQQVPVELDNQKYCTDCTAFMKDLQGVAANNKTIISELTELVKEQCSQFDPVVAELCTKAVDQVIPVIVDAIVSNDVNTICSTIMMCPATSQHKKMVTGNLCTDCTAFFGDWQEIIQNNKSVIEKQLKELGVMYCKQVPGFFESECDSVVAKAIDNYLHLISVTCSEFTKEYLPQLWDMISYNDAGLICSTLYMCEEADKPAVQPVSVAKQAPVGAGDPISCAVCKLVVHELDQMLEGNKTEAAVVAALEKVCSLMSGDIRQECQNFVDHYGRTLVDLIINEVESGAICSMLLLCSPQANYNKVSGSPTCEVCTLIATALDQLLTSNSTEQEIIAAVEKVCSILPATYKTECDSLIDQYGVVIIQLLAQELDPSKICAELGLCVSYKSQVSDSTTCELCELVAGELDSLLTENSTESEIIAAVEKVCTILPSNLQTECKTLIDQYGKEIINLLAQQIKPAQLCATLKLCTSYAVSSSTTCEVCELVASELDKLLTDKSTETEIVDAVENICKVLPANLQTECKDLIDQYGTDLINLLAQEIKPSELCAAIKLCSSYKNTQIKVRSDVTCELCTAVMTQVDKLLSENATQTEIVAALDKVCMIIPGDLKQQCVGFINDNGPMIIQLLLEEIAPSAVCSSLKLCSNSNKVMFKSSELCDVCKAAIGFLDQEVGANSTKAEVEAALDNLCVKLPASLKETCDDLVKQYTPEILDMIENIADPDYICIHLKLCTAQNHMLGANPCTFGPSYWCKNQQTATECNAVSHCEKHVWE
uniref:uncharacterized protein LOC100176110 isoform X2 n=1 Tax=Ciona intestinalis TaxID=7719 RepID=UPI000EF44333|nr:uncharacterized protein LOC100176110 isoform X2 [Ciona intestinalis]|eukprot:XP_026692825.1 uncharacterized protein LOC100176110 isoform X2 [Ciona intestinalis]